MKKMTLAMKMKERAHVMVENFISKNLQPNLQHQNLVLSALTESIITHSQSLQINLSAPFSSFIN